MKSILLAFALFMSISGLKAATLNSVQDGDFWAFSTWDCSLCLPQDGDTIYVHHNVTMSTNIYFSYGQIHITSNGSLIEDGNNRDIWIDGGSLVNHGTFDAYRLYVSQGFVENYGEITYLDSMWIKTPFTNNGQINLYDFLNDETANFENIGTINIDNNFNNQGHFDNVGTIQIGNDFSNCNIQSLDAIFDNTGVLCIGADFTNCADDTLKGSGVWYITGSSSNFGVFDENFVFHTPSGGLGVNTGTVSPSVTFGSNTCPLSATEYEMSVDFYPNPASTSLFVSLNQFDYQLYGMDGTLKQKGQSSGEIEIQTLETGTYFIEIQDVTGQHYRIRFMKF